MAYHSFHPAGAGPRITFNAACSTPLPCHRVVNRYGALSGRMHFEGPFVMEERLRSEGIAFTEEGHVDLEKHLWIPSEAKSPGI